MDGSAQSFIASRLCPRDGDGTSGCPAIEAIPICSNIFVLQFIVAFGAPLAMAIRTRVCTHVRAHVCAHATRLRAHTHTDVQARFCVRVNHTGIGNLLGEGRPLDARFCSRVAWGMAFGTQALVASLVLGFRRPVARLFVEDEDVLTQTVALMPLTTSYSVLATLSCGWSQQLMFGMGAKLRVPAAINFLCFFGVGIPAGAALAYNTPMGVRGTWAGLLVAIVLIVVGQYSFLFVTTDWAAASKRARERALENCRSAATTADTESDTHGLAAADSAAADAGAVALEMEEL